MCECCILEHLKLYKKNSKKTETFNKNFNKPIKYLNRENFLSQIYYVLT